jgi:hypothetical protein
MTLELRLEIQDWRFLYKLNQFTKKNHAMGKL